MGNCLLLLGLKKEKRPVTLLLVGLDNAGKTTAAKGILGDPVEDVAPTVGFAPEYLEYRGCEITIYDLGGGSKIRPVWSKYFSEIHGVIFVVDSSAPTRIRECKEVLSNLLADKKIAGKPVLVLANKQDIEGAMDEIDVVESLNVEQIVNKYKCPTRVETCSAITTRKQKPDKPIADGFRWLIDTIVVHYKEINNRVDNDMERERLQLKKEMEERRKRIRKLREERERQEALKREIARERAQAAHIGSSDDSDNEQQDIIQRPESSNIPNGILPQSRRIKKIQELKDPSSEDLNNSTDAEELKELGFKSRTELRETTSSSPSPQTSPKSSPPTEDSPKSNHESASPQKASSPSSVPPSKPHRVILVQESPNHLAAVKNDSSITSSPSSAAKDEDSGILDPNSSANTLGYGTPKLDLCNEERDDECVPIDSDDEFFEVRSSSYREENSDGPPRTLSNGSIMSYAKGEQLELENTSTKKTKKKSFLRRYHKTAPLAPTASPTGSDQALNHTSRIPPSLA